MQKLHTVPSPESCTHAKSGPRHSGQTGAGGKRRYSHRLHRWNSRSGVFISSSADESLRSCRAAARRAVSFIPDTPDHTGTSVPRMEVAAFSKPFVEQY